MNKDDNQELPEYDNKKLNEDDNQEPPNINNQKLNKDDNQKSPEYYNKESNKDDNQEPPNINNQESNKDDKQELPEHDNKKSNEEDNQELNKDVIIKELPEYDNKELTEEEEKKFKKICEKRKALVGFTDASLVYAIDAEEEYKEYTMKVLDVQKFDNYNLMKDLINCVNEMKKLNNPFILKEIYALENIKNDRTFEVCIISNLHSTNIISFEKAFPNGQCLVEDLTKIYGAEILISIEYLHQKGIILGESLKPSNILFEMNHVRLCDIGISKIISKHIVDKKNYMEEYREFYAPEIVERKVYDKNADWWNFGVILFYMFSGKRPIYYSEEKSKLTFTKNKKFDEVDKIFGGLISSLLNEDPAKRLGAGKDGIEEIKRHDFFKETNWREIESKNVVFPKLPEDFYTQLDLYQINY